MDLRALGGHLVCQKDSFLCAARGVSVGIAFQQKIGVGLFGGEGFIMQKLEGDGLCFVHAGGTIHHLDLAPGETLRVDTGCLVALQPSVNYDIQFVGKIKTALFGGEGLFFATLHGPRPRVAAVAAAQPHGRSHLQGGAADRRRRKEEGSILGGLGDLLDGRIEAGSARGSGSGQYRSSRRRHGRVSDDAAIDARPATVAAVVAAAMLVACGRRLGIAQPRTAFPEKRGLQALRLSARRQARRQRLRLRGHPQAGDSRPSACSSSAATACCWPTGRAARRRRRSCSTRSPRRHAQAGQVVRRRVGSRRPHRRQFGAAEGLTYIVHPDLAGADGARRRQRAWGRT